MKKPSEIGIITQTYTLNSTTDKNHDIAEVNIKSDENLDEDLENAEINEDPLEDHTETVTVGS